MRPESRKYLYDIREACRRLGDFTRSRSLDDYLANEMLRAAVERQFEIVGEALSQLYKLDRDVAETIPDARRIIAFRNILIHGYATIHHETVWGVVQSDLPVLTTRVAELLRSD
jgi:uncharacterized protein with HEPN domain